MAYGYRNTSTAVNDGGSREEPRPQSSYGSIWDRLLGNLTDKLNEAADVISDNTGTHFKPNADYQNWLNNFGTNRQNEEEPEQPAPQNNYEQPWTAPQQQNEEKEEPAPTPQEPINEQPAPAPASTPINTGRLGTSLLAEPLVEPVTEDQGKKNPSPSDFLAPYRNQPKQPNPVTEKNEDAPLTNSIMYHLINSGAGSGAGSAEITFNSGTPQQDVSVLGNGYVQPVTGGNTYWTGYRRNSYEPNGSNAALLNSLGNSILNGLNNAGTPAWLNPTPIIDNRINSGTPYRQTELDRAVKNSLAGVINSAMDNIGNSLRNQPGNILADSAGAFIGNRQGGGTNPFVNDAFNSAVRDTFAPPISSTIDLNSPVLSGNDPLAQYADLFEPQGGSQAPSISGGERMNPSISDFDERQALDVLNSSGNGAGSPGALYDALAGLANASESDGWANMVASDEYGRMSGFDPETPGWELLDEQRRNRNLDNWLAVDEILDVSRPDITGQEVKDAIDRSQNETREFTDSARNFAEIVTQPLGSRVDRWANQDNSGYDRLMQTAQAEAIRNGFYPGTRAYDNAVQNYMNANAPSTIMNQPAPANYDRDGTPVNQRYVLQTGSTTGGQPTTTAPQTTGSGSSGKNFVEGLGDWISGLFGGNNADGSNGTPRPGADAYLNNTQGGTTTPQGGSTSGNTPTTTPPATGNQTGGTTAPYSSGDRRNPDSSAYYSRKFDDLMEDNRDLGGTLNGESIRKLLDTPINVNNSFKDIIATDFAYDTRDPLSQGTDISSDQYKKELNAFLDANPTIKSMLENKEISVQDIINTYLKNPGAPASGSGSGSSKPDGSKTYQPSYGQEGPVVKAPYRKGGYSEDELKKMGNKPYTDYRGYKAYEGYYYNVYDKKWYPVDQDKANYYNTFGTYDGYNDDMKRYYNTFGTYYGYRPGWRTAGRAVSSGGGGGYGGGGYGGGSYSSSYSNSGYNNSSTPSTRNQDRNVEYNIMKNWAYN